MIISVTGNVYSFEFKNEVVSDLNFGREILKNDYIKLKDSQNCTCWLNTNSIESFYKNGEVIVL